MSYHKYLVVIVISMLSFSIIACSATPLPDKLQVEKPPTATQVEATSPAVEPTSTDEVITDTVNYASANEVISDTVEISDAMVNSVEVLVKESLPVQVDVMVKGALANGCTKVGEITQSFEPRSNGGEFIINIKAETTMDPEIMCIQQIIEFEEIIPLDVVDLPVGNYQVTVNGKRNKATFDLLADNTISTPGEGNPYSVTEWQQVEITEAGISIEVPADWLPLSTKEWSPDPTGMPHIGLNWLKIDQAWEPTDMLPNEQAYITGRLSVDLGWAEGLLYQVSVTGEQTTTQMHIIAPLDGDIAYDFYLTTLHEEDIGALQIVHEQFAKSAIIHETSATPCTSSEPDSQQFVGPADDYCLVYPAQFVVDNLNPTRIVIEKSTVSSDGLKMPPVILQIVSELAQVNTVDEVVQQKLQGLPASFTVRKASITLAGEPAVVVEGLPGRVETRQVFVLHDGRLYMLVFSPIDERFPQLQPEVDNLWRTVITSFSFERGQE